MNVDCILSETADGTRRMTEDEAAFLLSATGSDIWKIASAADRMRQERAGDIITYVRNMNIHVTNICKNCCGFCAFGVPADDPSAYFYSDEEIGSRIRAAEMENVTEICYLAGVHPEFTLDWYTGIIQRFHRELPGIHVHGCSPDEIIYMAERSGLSTREVLERLKEAGLDSVQGTAAEILDDDVRSIICGRKLSTAEWIRILREARETGFSATSTIMYGTVETVRHRAHHLQILRDIQDEGTVFTELVPLAFMHRNTGLAGSGRVTHGSFGREDLLMTAVSRLFLDNIANIQVPWTKIGRKTAQLCLCAGGNDLGGTMYSDSLSHRAGGGDDVDFCSPEEMEDICTDIGRPLRQRDTLYRLL